jgi:flagellar hook-length control protein FliK
MLSAAAESGSTGPKTRINSVRTSPAGMAARSNAPTSTVRLAAQHSVGMASSAPATTSLATLPGQMASSAQDSDRVAASRTAGSFDFLAETASLEGSSLGEALSTGAGSSSSNHESGAGNSHHDEGSLSWGGIGTDGLSQPNQLESTEAAANAFQEQMSELTQQMEQWFAQGTQSASLTLDADGAMPVDIEVTLDNGKVSIRFGSDEEGAREALMGSIEASLKPLLEQHGMSLADVQVTPGSGQEAQLSQQMAQNQQGNRSPQQEPQARTSRTGPSHSVAAASTASTPTTARPTRQPQGVVDLFA